MASRLSPPPPVDQLTEKDLKELSARVRESVRLRELTFVDPFPEEVQSECSICIMILKDPQIVTCCGHRFCEQCIGRVRDGAGGDGECPLCKASFVQYFSDLTLERQINQRKVYCPLKNDGCIWTGRLNKVTDHMDVLEAGGNAQPCLFFPVPCKYCGGCVRRHNMTAHEASCSSRPTNCQFCSDEVSNESLKDHYKTCTACPVHCPEVPCTDVMTRLALNQHLSKCEWSLTDCKFKHAGCNARIYRKHMEEHLQSNMEKHLDLLGQEFEKQKLIQAKEREVQKLVLELERKKQKRRQVKLEEEKKELRQIMQEKIDELENKEENKGEIQFLVISDLPEEALYDELKLKSRFGQYGHVEEIYLLDPSLNAGIVVYSSDDSYQEALYYKDNIRLCKQYVKVNPVYATETEDDDEEEEDEEEEDEEEEDEEEEDEEEEEEDEEEEDEEEEDKEEEDEEEEDEDTEEDL